MWWDGFINHKGRRQVAHWATSLSPYLWPCSLCRTSRCLDLLASSEATAFSPQHPKCPVISLFYAVRRGEAALTLLSYCSHKSPSTFAPQWQFSNQPDTSLLHFFSVLFCTTMLFSWSALQKYFNNTFLVQTFQTPETYFFQLKCSLPSTHF